ncbi:hypothetical protein FQA39_LY05937 [Lamprigera yunnana]|nr:hypothetical protein FQA39_LY05937 [Lamprigera yunnana]
MESRRKAALERQNLYQAGGGSNVQKDDPTKDFVLSIINEKTIFAVENNFDSDAVIQEMDVLLPIHLGEMENEATEVQNTATAEIVGDATVTPLPEFNADSGFKSTGIYPFDSHKFRDNMFVLSSLTERQDTAIDNPGASSQVGLTTVNNPGPSSSTTIKTSDTLIDEQNIDTHLGHVTLQKKLTIKPADLLPLPKLTIFCWCQGQIKKTGIEKTFIAQVSKIATENETDVLYYVKFMRNYRQHLDIFVFPDIDDTSKIYKVDIAGPKKSRTNKSGAVRRTALYYLQNKDAKEQMVKIKQLDLEQRRLDLEERRLVLDEKHLQMEVAKRKEKLEIKQARFNQEIFERDQQLKLIEQQHKLIVSLMETLPHLVEHNLLITFKYYLLPPAQDLYTSIKTNRSESHLNIYNSCIVVNNFIKTMDSIPTSCVQLAKEQIIKYSDPKYNINDLKTGDCETMLLNQTIYYLNKSKSKWISVGLYYPFEFASVVKIFGRSKQYVIFKEEEWIQFLEQRENINKYFQTFDTMWKPRQIGSKTLTFEMIEEKKILKIEDMSGNEVYLGWESVSEVWSLESVLRYRLSYSSGSNFKYFYEDVIRAVAEMSGDVKINIYNIINRLSEKSDDVCCMLEVLLFMPEKALFDVQLERRIQEQGQKRVKKHLLKKMWMLYAQEHWTKCYDLKSAVERLYEELGALEFDADHEAIYGMERYYTVQQCEELRDKYKIGRKVCRKFLQGRTCSQCLVKRISEIGLRHFLDTVNKYIKDCSDSSSSSDEEVFKAVEQNGEETTEEEEE